MTGEPPAWLRAGLWPCARLYGAAVRLRNGLFDAGLRRPTALAVPVVSVGNLTVGGTGKTPLVLWLVEQARRHGRAPGVLARGYGRARGAALNDEGLLLRARFPDLPQVQDPDRVRGGRALAARGVDLILLDDGYQHRRLHRDRDLVCLDACAPLADGRLLPAGRLREPPAALQRADVVVLTRAASLGPDELARRRALVHRLAGRPLPVFAAEHAPRDLVAMPVGETLPVAALRGRRVGLLSAIARPDAFEQTVAALGADIAWSIRRRDHHRFDAAELAHHAARARADDIPLIVTEKDEAKLATFPGPRWVLRIDLRFCGDPPPPDLLGLTLPRPG